MLEDITEFPFSPFTGRMIPIVSVTSAIGTMRPVWPTEVVKNEPMLFGCDLRNARLLGGPITKAWLDAFPSHLKVHPLIIDTRVHMLMPGFWPCIPGWHHDDVPRERSDGQPEYFNASYRSGHVATVVGDTEGLAATEFAVGDCPFPDIEVGRKYYREWSPMVDEAIADGFLDSLFARYGDLMVFGDRTWHRGTQADAFGWRWFARVSFGSRRPLANEVRRQVQVYMSDPIEGW